MSKVRQAVYLSFGVRYATLGIQALTVAILARLLTPAEIGVFSVSMSALAIAQALREFGIGNYIIQEPELDANRIRTALGVAICVSWFLAGVLFLLAHPLALIYREEGMERVVRVLSLIFILNPLGLPAYALLNRQLRLGPLTFVEVASSLAQLVVSVSGALRGASYMSLAYGQLAAAATRAALLLVVQAQFGFFWPSLRAWRHVVSFGAAYSAANIVNTLGNSGPELIIGRLLGFHPVALYGRGVALVNLVWQSVLSAVMSVATPSFAHTRREGNNLKEAFLRGTELLTGVAWPLYAFTACLALPLIRIAYGPQWVAAAPLARTVSIGLGATAITMLAGPLMTSVGLARQLLACSLITQSGVILLTTAGALISLTHAALGYAVSRLLGAYISFLYLNKLVGIRPMDLWSAARRSWIVTLGSLPGPLAASFFTDRLGTWWSLSIGGSTFTLGVLVVAKLCHHPIYHELRLVLRKIGAFAGVCPPVASCDNQKVIGS